MRTMTACHCLCFRKAWNCHVPIYRIPEPKPKADLSFPLKPQQPGKGGTDRWVATAATCFDHSPLERPVNLLVIPFPWHRLALLEATFGRRALGRKQGRCFLGCVPPSIQEDVGQKTYPHTHAHTQICSLIFGLVGRDSGINCSVVQFTRCSLSVVSHHI